MYPTTIRSMDNSNHSHLCHSSSGISQISILNRLRYPVSHFVTAKKIVTLNWEVVLFPGGILLQPYRSSIVVLLIFNPKTAKYIAQHCHVLLLLLYYSDLLFKSNPSSPVFHYISYAFYRRGFQKNSRSFRTTRL